MLRLILASGRRVTLPELSILVADGRTRDIGTGDYVTRGTSLAQIRIQDLKNQADESGAQVDAAVAQHTQAEQDLNRAKALYATQSLTKPDYDQAQARFDRPSRR